QVLSIRHDLALNKENTETQRDRSVSDNKVGDVLVEQRKLDDALVSYMDGLSIIRALASKDDQNTQWQRDLSVSTERVGDVLLAQGKIDQALRSYRESMAIRQTLAAKDESNIQWKWDLCIAHWRLGALGEDPAAHFEFIVSTLRQLAAKGQLRPEWAPWLPKAEVALARAKQNQ